MLGVYVLIQELEEQCWGLEEFLEVQELVYCQVVVSQMQTSSFSKCS